MAFVQGLFENIQWEFKICNLVREVAINLLCFEDFVLSAVVLKVVETYREMERESRELMYLTQWRYPQISVYSTGQL